MQLSKLKIILKLIVSEYQFFLKTAIRITQGKE